MRERKIRGFAAIGFWLLIGLPGLAQERSPPTETETDQLDHRFYQLCLADKYSEAIPVGTTLLELQEKALGPGHPDTRLTLSLLAGLYDKIGDYSKAGVLYQRALTITEKTLGPDHPDTARSLNNLAASYYNRGDYANAEPLVQRAHTIREKTLGPDHPDTATSLSNLAGLYDSMGDYGKAEPLLQRALEINQRALGPEHPDTGWILHNLAELYINMGEYAKAEPLLQRALRIRETRLGPEHPDTAASLNNVARLYNYTGDYTKAEPLYQRALKIRQKVLGPDHPDSATSLNNLALLYNYRGDYAEAEPLYKRALKIREKALGSDHPATASIRSNLALLYVANGNVNESLQFARLAQHAEEKTLSNILSFTSEQQRLVFQKTTEPYNLPATLGNAAALAEIVLRQKGVVLDSLLEDRLVAEASEDPRQHETITKLRAAKQQLMRALLEVPKDLSEKALKKRETEKDEFSQSIEELEAGLARQVAGLGRARRALSVTVSQVQKALSKNETLIELVRYRHYLGKTEWQIRYGAVVLAPSGDPKWAPLGAASEMENNVRLYQKSVRGNTDEPTLRKVLHTLHAQVWEPIEKCLPDGVKTIVVSPDAELSFVSFATLLGPDDKFVAEKYSVRYIASGRDLLQQTHTSGKKQTDVYANPDFGTEVTASASDRSSTIAFRSVEMRDLQRIALPPLPGTAAEGAALKKRASTSTKLFVGPNASEAELRKVDSPSVLHLATHGFFLPESDLKQSNSPLQSERDMPKGKLVNPMHRSGLALAGAQTTLQAWSRGEVRAIDTDGIVTAEEVGGLKLKGTDLVVLSACETGSGEARAGEGVMGLRRGFIQAGAKNLLMTLWPISDETTVKMMLDFYDAADKSHNYPQALADVQRDWLVKLREEKGLLPAVRLAGPFIMSSQGKP